MDLGWCVSCDEFGVSQDLEVVCQEDVMWWIWCGVCHVMDLECLRIWRWCVRRISCDGFGVVCVM